MEDEDAVYICTLCMCAMRVRVCVRVYVRVCVRVPYGLPRCMLCGIDSLPSASSLVSKSPRYVHTYVVDVLLNSVV